MRSTRRAPAQLIRANTGGSELSPGGDDSFAFTHDKIREVLYEELNPIRRRRLHQRIGETLENLHGMSATEGDVAGAPSDEHAQDLAHHFMHAGELPKSLAYSRRAARNAERVFAHDDALKFLEQARESAEALHRLDDRNAIHEQIGDIHEARGTTHPAIESYQRALGATTALAARAALNAKIGTSYCNVGDPRGLPYLEEALARLDPLTQTNELAIAMASVGRYYHYRTEHKKAIEFLERARQLAEPLDDPGTLGLIYSFLAGAHQHLLLYAESDRWARISMAMGERRKFPPAIALGYEFLSENAAGRGLWDEALASAAKNRDEGGKAGSLARVAWSGFAVAQALHGKGELAAGLNASQAALELSEQIGEDRLATWLCSMTAVVTADLGDDEAAQAYAERGWARAQKLGQLVLSAWALNALGIAAMQRGDFRAALGWYEQYVPLVRDTENAVARNLVMARAAEAFVLAGRVDDAAHLAVQAIALAEFADAPHYRALARRVHGQVLGAQRRYDDALQAFDDAAAEFKRLGSRLELARAAYHRAALRIARGKTMDLEDARAEAAQARDSFAEMGAVHDRALAKGLLTAMTLRPTPSDTIATGERPS